MSRFHEASSRKANRLVHTDGMVNCTWRDLRLAMTMAVRTARAGGYQAPGHSRIAVTCGTSSSYRTRTQPPFLMVRLRVNDELMTIALSLATGALLTCALVAAVAGRWDDCVSYTVVMGLALVLVFLH